MNISSLLQSYVQRLFFPNQTCLLCEKPLHGSNQNHLRRHYHVSEGRLISPLLERILHLPHICTACKQQIEIPQKPFCQYCHKPKNKKLPMGEQEWICNDCRETEPFHSAFNRSAVLYNMFMKNNIALYKYRGKESLATIFSYLLKIAYEQYYEHLEIDILTYVPLHPNRLMERGFNQAEQLAERLGPLVGKPVYDGLQRRKDTGKQSKRNKWERLKQIEGSFQIKDAFISRLQNKNILLIDDIYTTGATTAECAKIMKKAGAKKVYSLTLARAFEQLNDDKMESFV